MLHHKTDYASSSDEDDAEIHAPAHPSSRRDDSNDKLWGRIRRFLLSQNEQVAAAAGGSVEVLEPPPPPLPSNGNSSHRSSARFQRLAKKASLRPVRSEYRSPSPHSCCRGGSESADHTLMHNFLHIKPIRRCFTCKRGFCDIEEHHAWSADVYKQFASRPCVCTRNCPRHWKGRIATEAAIGAGLLHAETGKNIRFRDDDDSDRDDLDDMILFNPKLERQVDVLPPTCHGFACRKSESIDKPQRIRKSGQLPYLTFLPLWFHQIFAWTLLTLLCAWLCLKIQYVVVKHMPWETVAKWLQYALNPGLLPWRLIKKLFHPTFRIHPTLKLSDISALYAQDAPVSDIEALEQTLLHLILPLKGGWIFKELIKPFSLLFSRPIKDGSDSQWHLWLHQLPLLLFIAAIHITLTRIITWVVLKWNFFRKYRKDLIISGVQALLGALVIAVCHSPTDCVIIGSLVLIFYAISLLARTRITRWLVPYLTWTLCMALLSICSWVSIPNYRSKHHYYPLRKLIPILILKLVSYNMDKFWSYKHKAIGGTCDTYEQCEAAISDEQSLSMYDHIGKTYLDPSKFNLVNYLGYTLYIPLWIAGPILPFQAYVYQLNKPYRASLWKDGVVGLVKLFGMTMLIEYVFSRTMLVSVFFGSVDTSTSAATTKAFEFMWPLLTPIEILTGITSALIYLWLKFKIIWGVFRGWSMLAGFHTPDNLPRFLFNHVSMQDFWRSWHMSYHLWLRRYIYAPLRSHYFTKSLSVVLVYFFVGAWHQINLGFSVWAGVVSATACIEFAVEHLYHISYKQRPLPIPQSNFFKALAFASLSTTIVQLCLFANALGYAIGTKGFFILAKDVFDRPVSWLFGLMIYSTVAYIWCTLILRQAAQYRMVTFEKPKMQ